MVNDFAGESEFLPSRDRQLALSLQGFLYIQELLYSLFHQVVWCSILRFAQCFKAMPNIFA
jgi:hypothetical protein